MAPEVHVVYGGQFGSEAKRLFTEYYANKFKPDAIITNALPNSGGFDSKGRKWSALLISYLLMSIVVSGTLCPAYYHIIPHPWSSVNISR